MNQGDYVIRKSYGGDVVFRIEEIEGDIVYLRGIEFRLLADAPLSDLETVADPFHRPGDKETRDKFKRTLDRLFEFRKRMSALTQESLMRTSASVSSSHDESLANTYFEVPGKVLHLDGDASYLRKSMDMYGELRVPAEGHHIAEKDMADALYRLLPRVRPHILVITGHDGMYKNRGEDSFYTLSNYKNSQNFVNAIHTARQYERNFDSLVIIAGACQSHFEALLQAGANFASSPARILIHAMDPVQIASKAAYTSMKETVSMSDVAEHTMTGMRGMGGIETKGCYRIGVPNFMNKKHKNQEIR